MTRKSFFAPAAVLLLVALSPLFAADPETEGPGPKERALSLQGDLAKTIARVRPAVVAIVSRMGRRTAGGSGVFIDAKGLILTNDHVVGGADDIKVVLPGRRRLAAELVGRDREGDLALIRVSGDETWPSVALGDSDALRPGQMVIALGNPRGISLDGEPTVTLGVVTALHCIGGGRSEGGLFYGDAIQTDAEINPGNSGGPLFDSHGRLMGINGRIATLTRIQVGAVNSNVGYSIPSNQIRRFLPLLKKGGDIRHGYLGVRVDPVSGGLLVVHVVAGSAAAKAGIRPGDRLLALDGQALASDIRLTNLVSSHPSGGRIALRYERDGSVRIVIVVLGKRSGEGREGA